MAALADARAFATYLAPLRKAEWVVYAKRPFGGPQAVLAYLSRYTHRVAISNSRLIALDEAGVTFKWKDYRANGRERAKVMTLANGEFIRRFLIHVLPGRLPSHSPLRPLRQQQVCREHRPGTSTARRSKASEPERRRRRRSKEPQTPSHPCPCCGGRMIIIETFVRGCAPRIAAIPSA